MARHLSSVWTTLTMAFLVVANANAGHLFTQSSANTAIDLEAGSSLEITQQTFEGGGPNGLISLNFKQISTGDAAEDWSAGDALTLTIESYSRTFTFDTLAADIPGATQTASSLVANDPTLAAANITPTPGVPLAFTVAATSGRFTLEGYRIFVNGATLNGTGAAPIDQSQVVTAEPAVEEAEPVVVVVVEEKTKFEPDANSNQKGLGSHLDSINGNVTGGLATVISFLEDLTPESKALALKIISPQQSQVLGQMSTATVAVGLDNVEVRLDAIRNNFTQSTLADGSDERAGNHRHHRGLSSGDYGVRDRHGWLRAVGGKSRQNSEDGFAGSNNTVLGAIGGMDITTPNDLTLGVAFGYTRTAVDMDDFRSGDDTDIDTYQLTTYFNKTFDEFYLEGMLSYAYQDYTTSRNTHLTGIARGDFHGNMYAARLVGGYPIDLTDEIILTPYVGGEVLHISQKSYTETGAGVLSLNVASSSADRFGTYLGFKLRSIQEFEDGSVLSPMIQFDWRREWKVDGIDSRTSFVGGGGDFQSIGQNIDHNVFSLTGRLDWRRSDAFSLGVEVGGKAASKFRSYNGRVYAKWRF